MNHVKILFEYPGSSEGQHEVESMWARPDPSGYAIDNIPFHVKELALNDIVSVKQGPDGELWYDALVEPSGHSTVRLWFQDVEDVQRVRDELRNLGCHSELSELPRLVAVDIPPGVSYSTIKSKLDEGEHAGYFEYEEACLGQNE